MKGKKIFTPKRAAEIFEEMISARREYCSDNTFFRMDEVWKFLCEDNEGWSIKTFRSKKTEAYKRKAGVVAFEDRVMLTVDEQLLNNARKGCLLSNFTLAHELGHLGLDHHATGAVTKNFQLFAGPNGHSNIPPTLEELEANYAAVFFQCGVALFDQRWDKFRLARRAYSDPLYVGKAQQIVRLEVFQKELAKLKPKYERVIL